VLGNGKCENESILEACMSDTDENSGPDCLWLLVGGTLMVHYALGHRTTGHSPLMTTKDDFALARAEIVGFLLGAFWAIVKQVVLPPSQKAVPATMRYDQRET